MSHSIRSYDTDGGEMVPAVVAVHGVAARGGKVSVEELICTLAFDAYPFAAATSAATTAN